MSSNETVVDAPAARLTRWNPKSFFCSIGTDSPNEARRVEAFGLVYARTTSSPATLPVAAKRSGCTQPPMADSQTQNCPFRQWIAVRYAPMFLTVTLYVVALSLVAPTVVRAGGGVCHLMSNSV